MGIFYGDLRSGNLMISSEGYLFELRANSFMSMELDFSVFLFFHFCSQFILNLCSCYFKLGADFVVVGHVLKVVIISCYK